MTWDITHQGHASKLTQAAPIEHSRGFPRRLRLAR
jgi:hypothetical protein